MHNAIAFISGYLTGIIMFRTITAFILLSFSLPSFAGYINHNFQMQTADGAKWDLNVEVNEFWKLNREFTRDSAQLDGPANSNGFDMTAAYGAAIGDVYGIYDSIRVDYAVDFWSFAHNANSDLVALSFQTVQGFPFQETSFYWGKSGDDFQIVTHGATLQAADTMQHYANGAGYDEGAGVPEPATAALLGLTLAGFGASRLLKRKI